MRTMAVSGKAPVRGVVLSLLTVAVLMVPDATFSFVTTAPAEVMLLRMLTLVGVSLLAVVPWAETAPGRVRRRMRRWATPGVIASAIYLLSTDPFFLLMGFCLLVGAALDVWAARAHVASESLRVRLARQANRDR